MTSSCVKKVLLEMGHFEGLFNSIKEIEFHGSHIIDNADDLGKNGIKEVS